MQKYSYIVGLFLLSLLTLEQTVSAPSGRTTKKPTVKTTTRQKVQNLDTLCHLLNYGEFTHSGLTTHTLNIAGEPIRMYQTGYKNRVEYVHAVITPQSIATGGSETTDKTRAYARSMGKPTDDAGHIIANQLGGTGKENYNIFPQSPNINRGAWSKEEKAIRTLVEQTQQPIDVVVQLYYSDSTSTRPTHFIYRAAYGNACHSADVINP